jgi:hypothetical protein
VHTGTDGPRCRRPSPPSQSWPMPRVLFLCSRRTFIGPRGLVHLGGGVTCGFVGAAASCCTFGRAQPRTHALHTSHSRQTPEPVYKIEPETGSFWSHACAPLVRRRNRVHVPNVHAVDHSGKRHRRIRSNACRRSRKATFARMATLTQTPRVTKCACMASNEMHGKIKAKTRQATKCMSR